jgi:hypothetical protein
MLTRIPEFLSKSKSVCCIIILQLQDIVYWHEVYSIRNVPSSPPCSDVTRLYLVFRWHTSVYYVQVTRGCILFSGDTGCILCSGDTRLYLVFRRHTAVSCVQATHGCILCSGDTRLFLLFRWGTVVSRVQVTGYISCSVDTRLYFVLRRHTAVSRVQVKYGCTISCSGDRTVSPVDLWFGIKCV